jgi:hypothetical protein
MSIADDISTTIAARGGLDIGRVTTPLDKSIIVPAGCELVGHGARSILYALGDFPAVVVMNADGSKADRAVIGRFSIKRANTLGSVLVAQTSSDGILLWGDEVRLDEIHVDDCWNGVKTRDIPDLISPRMPTARGVNSVTDNGITMAVDQYAGAWYIDLGDGNAPGYQITGNSAHGFVLAAGGRVPTAGPYSVTKDPASVTSDDTSNDLVTTAVRVAHSNPGVNTSQWGLQFNAVDRLTVRDGGARGAQLDGLKTRRNCRDILIDGGLYEGNRQGGLDLFAGGGYMTVRDVVANANGLGVGQPGINIKTSALSPAYGNMRNIEVIGARARGNGGNGLGIGRDVVSVVTEPQVIHVAVRGGVYDGNCIDLAHNETGAGVIVDARSVEVEGVLSIRNKGPGLWVRQDARDVRIRGGRYVANGVVNDVKCNIIIDGQRVRVDHPICLGKDGLGVTTDADFDALPAVTEYGILIQSSASDVTLEIDDSDFRGHSAMRFAMGGVPGPVIAHITGTGDPIALNIWPCSNGSTYHRRDGGVGTSLYVKETAAQPNDPVGWKAHASA